MSSEYEGLLSQMLQERRSKLGELKSRGAEQKSIEAVESEIRFIEVELERFQKGLALFRTKSVPKVGRWGRPEPLEESSGH